MLDTILIRVIVRVYIWISLSLLKNIELKNINKNNYRFIDKCNLKEAAKMSNKTMLNKDIIIGIDIDTSINNLKILDLKDIDRNYKTMLMYNIALKDIEKYRN